MIDMLKKKYADMAQVLHGLNIPSGGSNKPDQDAEGRTCREIIDAVLAAQVDAVEVVRCRNCAHCIRSEMLRMPRCICPSMPAHMVQPDGYCDSGVPKSLPR